MTEARLAIGIVEVSSIAVGFRSADAMLKAAGVRLLDAYATSPGKYLTVVGGDVAAVAASVEAGVAEAGETLVGRLLIAHLHSQVLQVFRGYPVTEEVQAVGVVETSTVAAAVRAADAAVKTAVVDLLDVRLARGLGGKGYVSFTGDVGSVLAGTEAGAAAARQDGALVGTSVIPAPHEALKAKLRSER